MHNIDSILSLLPHRYPFVMIDRVLSVDPDQISVIKNVTYNEPCFQGHFPRKPILPGVYMIEALAQAGGVHIMLDSKNTDKLFFLARVDKAKFRKLVVPGDQLQIACKLVRHRQSLYHYRGHIMVEDEKVMEADFWLARGSIDD